ncbi:MAG: hypothetical protein AB1640_00190 [bacterium]
MFSRTESLEQEPEQMKVLSKRLAAIPKTSEPSLLEEAKRLIAEPYDMNMRWNIPELTRFLLRRQRELSL